MPTPEDIQARAGSAEAVTEPGSAKPVADNAVDVPGEEAQPDEIEVAPASPRAAIGSLILTVAGFGTYEYVLLSFWSSPSLGIHQRIPYPAYACLIAALILTLAGFGAALSIRSVHTKFGLGLLALLASAAVGLGGGRFVSYTLKGTLNPSYILHVKVGDQFPAFELPDQNGAMHKSPGAGAQTLIVIYRGDFCPFARFELGELTRMRGELSRGGLGVLAISADPPERSRMLAGFLGTDIPLLSDVKETVLAPLGLVQHHRNGEPDNALPAFFILDQTGRVRWIFTSPYYREMPSVGTLLRAAASVKAADGRPGR